MTMTKILLPILLSLPGILGAQAAGSGPSGPGSPDSLAWDWTRNDSWTVYYSKSGLPFPGIASTVVTSPFWIQGHSLQADMDMYPEDGWMLVYKDFGTPGKAGPVPSFALYNRFNGKLRIIFFNAHEDSNTYLKINFSWANGDRADAKDHCTANLVFSENERCFRSDFDPAHQEIAIGFSDKEFGWFYFDLPMAGYDPDVAWKRPILNFRITSVTIGNLQGGGDGGLVLNQIERGQAIPGASLGGKTDFEAFRTGYKWYHDTKEWVTTELGNPKNSGEPWFKLGQRLITAFPAVTTFAPYATGLAGIITSFIGGTQTTPAPVPMNFKGKLDFGLHATYTTEHSYYRDGLQLAFGGGDSSAHAPVQPIPWGVFSLESRPKVLVRRVLVRRRLERSIARGSVPGGADLQGYRCVLASLPSLNLNPDTGLSLVSARYAFTREDAGPTDYVADPSREPILARNVPTGLAVELRFALPSHRNADPEEVVLKTVPVDVEMGPPIVSAEE